MPHLVNEFGVGLVEIAERLLVIGTNLLLFHIFGENLTAFHERMVRGIAYLFTIDYARDFVSGSLHLFNGLLKGGPFFTSQSIVALSQISFLHCDRQPDYHNFILHGGKLKVSQASSSGEGVSFKGGRHCRLG